MIPREGYADSACSEGEVFFGNDKPDQAAGQNACDLSGFLLFLAIIRNDRFCGRSRRIEGDVEHYALSDHEIIRNCPAGRIQLGIVLIFDSHRGKGYLKARSLGRSQKLLEVDIQYRDIAEKIICDEFAYVLGTEPKQIKERLVGAVKQKRP